MDMTTVVIRVSPIFKLWRYNKLNCQLLRWDKKNYRSSRKTICPCKKVKKKKIGFLNDQVNIWQSKNQKKIWLSVSVDQYVRIDYV